MKLICLTLVAFVLGLGNIHAQKSEKHDRAPQQVRSIEIEKVSDPVVVKSEISESTAKVVNKNASRALQASPDVIRAKQQSKIAAQKTKQQMSLAANYRKAIFADNTAALNAMKQNNPEKYMAFYGAMNTVLDGKNGVDVARLNALKQSYNLR